MKHDYLNKYHIPNDASQQPQCLIFPLPQAQTITMCNAQQISVLLFYILCFETLKTNSRTSTLWKLNSDKTKIVEASPFHQVASYQAHGAQFVTEDDPVFNIITSTVHMGQSWEKHGVEYYCTNCHTVQPKSERFNFTDGEEVLDCGKPVNFTYYDNLVGVLNRYRHPMVPEPQAALTFTKNKKNGKGQPEFDINALERKLKKAKREVS